MSKYTESWLRERLKSNPQLTCPDLQVGGSGKVAKLERPAGPSPLQAGKAKGEDTGRFLVVITSIRKILLDEDNLAGKYHCDCLRYAGILPSDAPDKTSIKVSQRKAEKDEEERVIVELYTL